MVESSRKTHTVDGMEIAPVIEPSSFDELIEVINELNSSDGYALVAGSGTRLRYGNNGGPFDRVISTARLDSILEYSPDDLTIAIQSGVTIESARKFLAESGQMLAVNAPFPGSATVGGSYATGFDGPCRLEFGSLKDSVIGVEAVIASGNLVKSGGMVVKNVTGYDMSGVFHGSLGAFGIVTRLNLKVMPQPELFCEYVFTFEQVSDALTAGISSLLSGLELTGICIKGASAGEHRLHLALSGVEAAVRRQGAQLCELIFESCTPADTTVMDLDYRQISVFDDFVDMRNHRSIARLSCPASKQQHLLELIVGNDKFHSWEYLADPGSGLVYLHTNEQVDPTITDVLDIQTTWMATEPATKKSIDVFGSMPDRNLQILRNMKHEFDPAGRFNRGRFIDGL